MKTLRILGLLFVIIILSTCEGEKTAPANVNNEVVETKPANTNDEGINQVEYGPGRNHWQRPELIIGILGNENLSDMTIVDIGAGTGFFTFLIAPLVKKVIALDIDQNFLDVIDDPTVSKLSNENQNKIETRLTPRDGPRLDANEADAILIVNTFMFFENKLDYLTKLKNKIKPGGKLVIVDFKRKRTEQGPRPRKHRAPLYMVEDLLYEAGYKNIKARDTDLREQYILVAER